MFLLKAPSACCLCHRCFTQNPLQDCQKTSLSLNPVVHCRKLISIHLRQEMEVRTRDTEGPFFLTSQWCLSPDVRRWWPLSLSTYAFCFSWATPLAPILSQIWGKLPSMLVCRHSEFPFGHLTWGGLPRNTFLRNSQFPFGKGAWLWVVGPNPIVLCHSQKEGAFC